MKIGPVFNSGRDLRVGGPEDGRLRKGNGEAKVRGKSVEPLKEREGLIRGSYDSNVIDIGRDSEISKAV